MRHIIHKTFGILNGRGKVIVLREQMDDHESMADVRKNFIYIASLVPHEEPLPEPCVHVKKSFDSINRIEKFTFRVKSCFFVDHNRQLLKVAFRHTLRINLRWKSLSTHNAHPAGLT